MPNRDIDRILSDVIESLHRPFGEIPDEYEVAKLRTLFYMWLVVHSKDGFPEGDVQEISEKKLSYYLGEPSNFRPTVTFHFPRWIKFKEKCETRPEDGGCYVIKTEDLQKIHNVLEEYYHITQPVPYIDIPGHMLVKYLYRRADRPSLADEIMLGFHRAFSGNEKQPSPLKVYNAISTNDTDVNGIAKVQCPQENWDFLVAVFPNRGAIKFHDCGEDTDIDTVRIAGEVALRSYRENFASEDQEIKNALVISPDFSERKAFKHIVASPHVYHVRPLELIQFFWGIYEAVESNGYDPRKTALRLDEIFPDKAMWNFNAAYALDILLERKDPPPPEKSYIIPIILPPINEDGFNADDIKFGYNREGGLRDDPYDDSRAADEGNDYLPQHRRSISSVWYGYRVITICGEDDGQHDLSGYHFASLSEMSRPHFRGKLEEHEASLVRSAVFAAQDECSDRFADS